MKLFLICTLFSLLLAGCYKEKSAEMYSKADEIPEQSFDTAITNGTEAALPKTMFCMTKRIHVHGDSFSRWYLPGGQGVGGVSWLWQFDQMLHPLLPSWSFAGSGSTSSQAKDIFMGLADKYMTDNHIIWTGRNNYGDTATVRKDIETMIARLKAAGNNRYLIIGILKGDYPSEYNGQPGALKIDAFNARMAMLHRGHFINPQPALQLDYNSVSDADQVAFYNGFTPASLRADRLHLNTVGYGDIAKLVFNGLEWCGCN